MVITHLFAFIFSQWAVAQPLPPLPARPLIPLAHCQAPNVDALLSTDVPRTYWLQSFGMSGARYRDATIQDLGPVASQPVLTLTGPFELTEGLTSPFALGSFPGGSQAIYIPPR